MRSDFIEALERQEIQQRDEEEDVRYRTFTYCPANPDHQHQMDIYDVSGGTVGKCISCGRTFRGGDFA